MHRMVFLKKRLAIGRVVGVALCLGVATTAYAADPINVTALPLPHALCPGVTNAVPNGGPDYPAFQCAIDIAAPEGAEIYIPAGTYHIAQKLTVTGKSIAFRGEGQRITNLLFGNATGQNGLELLSASAVTHNAFAVRSLSILRETGAGGAAIYAKWPNNLAGGQNDFTNGNGVSITIEDVHIGAETGSWTNIGPYWERGIWLSSPRFAKIQTFNIHGYPETSVGFAGIQISANSPDDGARPIGVAIHDGSILGYHRGVHAVDQTSGLNAQNLKIRDAVRGVDLAGTGAGTSIANCHIRATARGIAAINTAGDMAIVNNVIYRDGEGAFYGIELDAVTPAPRSRIIGNIVTASDSGATRYGISLANNIKDTIIEYNITQNMNAGIRLAHSSVTGTMVLGNRNNWVSPGTAVLIEDPSTLWYQMHNR